MFTARGLFSEVLCPYQETCVLPRCIFKHQAGTSTIANSTATTQDQLSVSGTEERQAKRQKLNDENLSPSNHHQDAVTIGLGKEVARPASPKSKLNEKPTKSLAATRAISPPPLRRKAENGALSVVKQTPSQKATTPIATTPKPAAKIPHKAPLRIETLNPRALTFQAPASHDMRFRLVRALHDQMLRLNNELAKDASDAEEALVLSEQALITRALDIEQDAAGSASIYANVVKNKIYTYKKMSVKQWVEERSKEVAQEQAKQAAILSEAQAVKTSGPPKTIETGLSTDEELTLLHRLYTPISSLSQHGYVSTIPTDKEIESANQGVEASKGWEVCDRCKTRFQVFPGRREEDGALQSGGKCTYHYGKPYWQDRPAGEPKAKREKKYRCCGESIGESSGCTQAENHVFKISEVKRLAAILNFEKTPENLDMVADRPVCIDCEMGYTVYGLELIRLTATSWPSGAPLLDVLVRPVGPILDLNSRYSGVWPKDMAIALPWTADAPKQPELDPSTSKPKLRIVDSPASARALLFTHLSPLTPLIGHGLENDLNATRLIHPTVIDTALLYPHKAGLPYRNGLKALMQTHLNRHIQVVVDGKMEGHDSKEDANAAGDLVRLALANEWKKMQREGWVVNDGVFKPPTPREGAAAGSGGRLSVLSLEREEPVRILSVGAGRKREREEMEEGEV